ncbi:MAG: hypothetical protein ACYDH4_10545 [Candidatus Cryosericum sp.]
MQVMIPWDDRYPQYQLSVTGPAGTQTLTLDDSHRMVDVTLPPGVRDEDVDVIGNPLDQYGRLPVDCAQCVLRARVERPVPRLPRKHAPRAEAAGGESPLRRLVDDNSEVLDQTVIHEVAQGEH